MSHYSSYSLLAECVAAGVLCRMKHSRMRHWVAVLLLVCVVFHHLHGALGKRKPNIIIFFVNDVSGRLSDDSDLLAELR